MCYENISFPWFLVFLNNVLNQKRKVEDAKIKISE